MPGTCWRPVLAAALLLASAAAPRAEGPEDAIRARLETWADAFNAADPGRVCEIYAGDFEGVWPGLPDADKAAACDRVDEVLGDPARDVTYAPQIEEILIAPSGDFAAVRAVWTLGIEDAGSVTTSQERRLDILTREADGAWRIRRSIGFPAEEMREPPG
ncbi:YybH family protein [Amaricoccus solimangrovi]|nr:nuclear transport factor 2 family protein [Amaricoccus solimangrovi]